MTYPDAIHTLEHVIRAKPTRENRLTELLKDPSAETAVGWFMCVPTCFNDALDIKQTERVENGKKTVVWTQGSSFSFKAGDTVYDSDDAYKVWSDALKSISLCVQIKTASSAGPSEGSSGRFSGSVTFAILTPKKDRSSLVERAEHTMSQDEFVRLLIAGPSDDLMKMIGKSQQEN